MQVPVELLVAKALGARSQDASITLQQLLKTGTNARKTEIIQAMTPHILRLSDDKHGNFLVQRAGESGEIVMILNLTKPIDNLFSCHSWRRPTSGLETQGALCESVSFAVWMSCSAKSE